MLATTEGMPTDDSGVGTAPSPLVDAENQTVLSRPAADAPAQQVLAARTARSLRAEAVADDGRAREWAAVTRAFKNYLMTQHTATETWTSDHGVPPTSHRFTAASARQKEGRIRGGLRHVRDETPDTLPLRTVLLTVTGWPFDAEGRPAPPVDFLDGLNDGLDAVHRTLRRRLDGHDAVPSWGRVTVLAPHEEGRRQSYPHAHVGAVVVGPVDTDTFAPVVDAYLDANPYARRRDHEDGHVRVRDGRGDGEPFEALGAELARNLVGYHFDATDGTPLDGVVPAVRRGAALLWATGTRSCRFGGTFREWVARSQADHTADGDSNAGADGDDGPPPAAVANGGGGPDRVEPTTQSVAFAFPDEDEEEASD